MTWRDIDAMRTYAVLLKQQYPDISGADALAHLDRMADRIEREHVDQRRHLLTHTRSALAGEIKQMKRLHEDRRPDPVQIAESTLDDLDALAGRVQAIKEDADRVDQHQLN